MSPPSSSAERFDDVGLCIRSSPRVVNAVEPRIDVVLEYDPMSDEGPRRDRAMAPRSARRSRFRWLRWLAGALALCVVAVAAYIVVRRNDHPSLEPYESVRLGPSPASADGGVTVTFLGVSTVLVNDGETAILTDGFFSRPPMLRTALGTIAPDRAVVDAMLARAGITKLAAVIVVHSHYDHVMDAPLVAERTGAMLVGSESTANVGRGAGLAEERMHVARDTETLRFGRLEVTLVPSRHLPHGMAIGSIDAPLVTPARASDYLEGGSWSVLIRHPSGSLLVQGSAGWLDGALAGRQADVVLLGIAGLGTQPAAYRERYLAEVVDAVGARLVIPIHWDDFTLPLSEPLVPMPRLLDDFPAGMALLQAHAAEPGGPRLALLPAFTPVRLLPLEETR
jgi:L-ascorbate metabolism protein UlaG (beta-lactamase superfamily)